MHTADARPSPVKARHRFLIIHNPLAGKSRRHVLVKGVAARLVSLGAHAEVAIAPSFEAGRDMARQAAAGGDFDAVVAAGGDSTVRGLAAGLAGTGIPLGLIPVGTGNVLGSELGLLRNAEKLARGLLDDRDVPVRVALANGQPFLLMASAGFDAHVLSHLDQVLKRRIGKLAYAGPILRGLHAGAAPFEAVIDGRRAECNWLIVTRAARYGGSFVLAPRQSLLDDHFHAVLIKARSRLGLLRSMVAIASGAGPRLANVEIVPCARVQVPACPHLMAQLDGELFQSLPLNISADGPLLNLIVPGNYPSQIGLNLTALKRR